MIGARANIGPYGWFLILDEILGKDEVTEMSEATAKAPRTKFSFTYRYGNCDTNPTILSRIDTGASIFCGWSYCLPGDRYEKSKGRVLAITRALKDYKVPRETRREIWAEYWAQGHRRPR